MLPLIPVHPVITSIRITWPGKGEEHRPVLAPSHLGSECLRNLSSHVRLRRFYFVSWSLNGPGRRLPVPRPAQHQTRPRGPFLPWAARVGALPGRRGDAPGRCVRAGQISLQWRDGTRGPCHVAPQRACQCFGFHGDQVTVSSPLVLETASSLWEPLQSWC